MIRARKSAVASSIPRTTSSLFFACVTDWAGELSIASQGPSFTGKPGTHVNYLKIEGRANAVGKALTFTTVTISKKTETDLDEHFQVEPL